MRLDPVLQRRPLPDLFHLRLRRTNRLFAAHFGDLLPASLGHQLIMATAWWRDKSDHGGNGGGIGAGVGINLVCVSSVLKRFDKLTLLTTHNMLPRQTLFSNH